MSKDAASVDREMVNIILSALEAPRAGLSALTFASLKPQTRVRLLNEKLIRPEGYDPVHISDDDSLVSLTWTAEQGGYGYFDLRLGWVAVPHQDIASYAIDFPTLLGALTKRLQIQPIGAPQALLNDNVWQIGRVRLGPQSQLTPVYFARCLHDGDVSSAMRVALEARPTKHRYPILTSTRVKGLPVAPPKGEFISLHEVLSEGLALNPSAITSRLYRLAAETSDPLVLIAGAKQVIFFGKTYKFPRGVQQRRIIEYLVACSAQGDRRVSADKIIADLDLPMTARIRDYFHKHPAWGQLLTVRDGMCGFCWPDEK